MQADSHALRQGADALQQTALSCVRSQVPARLAIEGNQQVGDSGEVDDNSEDDDPQA
jgi:hypothetical protein